MKRALTIVGAMLCGCGSYDTAAPATSPSPSSSGSASVPPPGGGGDGAGGVPAEIPNPPDRSRCQAPPGSGSPGTIEQALALLNALPKPTSVACFVESLDRPLAAFATNSPFSAQPALSTASPRVFLRIGQLWLSIVIDGRSSELVEFGYLIPSTLRSIKAELHFPLSDAVEPGAPYARVRYGERGTACRFCHFDEQAESVPGIDDVFSSVAFKPRPDSRVPIESLRRAAEVCDWHVQPHRCEMLSAVFGGGPVVEEPFPSEMPTFF